MKLHRLYALMLVLGLAGFPLVASFSTVVSTSSTPFSIGLRISILAVSMLIILYAFSRKHTFFIGGWLGALWFLFWGAYFVRIFYETIFRASILFREPAEYWYWALGACMIPSTIMLTKVRSEAYQRAYKWSFALLICVAFAVVIFGGTEVSTEFGESYDIGRLHLESLNPIYAGHAGLSLLLLSVWSIMFNKHKMSLNQWIIRLIPVLLGIYVMVAAASRGPIVALFCVICFYFLSVNFRKSSRLLAFAVIICVLGYVFATLLEESGQFQMLSRIENTFSGDDAAVTGRQVAISGAFLQFLSSPIVGSALEEKITGFYPHNVVLESFMATGIIGGLPFITLITIGFFSAYRLFKCRSDNAWVALIFIQYMIAAQFSGAIYNSNVMWMYLAATISVQRNVKMQLVIPKINSLNRQV